MSWEAWATVVGTLVTGLGTAVTIISAFLTKGYRDQVKFDIRKIHLSGAVDDLRRALEEIRKLPTAIESIPRGLRIKEIIHEIRSRFDGVLGILAVDSPDGDIRLIMSHAQSSLNEYETSFDANALNSDHVYELQRLVQDAVSASNSRIFKLEGKA